MQKVYEWANEHGISRGSLCDRNYGLSFPSKGTRPFDNHCFLARINDQQRDELIKLGVDPMFISPLISKLKVYLILIYCTDKDEVGIDPLEKDYVLQLFEAYKKMYNVFLLQNFIKNIR